MTAQYPSSQNVFVKDHEATGRLTINYSRNVDDFAVNSYTQIIPVTKVSGYYLDVTVEEAGRLVNSDLSNFAWADGQPAPTGYQGTESHQWKEYLTKRYLFPVTLGDLTVDQSSWDIKNQYAAIKAQQAMTARTKLAVGALTTSGNYATGHNSAVASISGNTGTWAASTTARQDIKRSLNYAADLILQDTLSAVDINDLVLVMSPGCAKEISECQEIVDHIKGSPEAHAQIRGELPGKNAIFGLPDKLYGFPVVIEKTVNVTTRKGATTSKSYVLPNATPFMVARPGGLIGQYGSPNFSTCACFMYAEMETEVLRKEEDRLTIVRVSENYDHKVISGVSGFLFTSAV